jgi:RimJ/RimL family protein N-acetyltransferase
VHLLCCRRAATALPDESDHTPVGPVNAAGARPLVAETATFRVEEVASSCNQGGSTLPDDPFVSAHTSTVELADGTVITLRPLDAGDKGLVVTTFEGLSPHSRYRRFFSPIPRLTESTLAWLFELDYEQQFAWGAVIEEHDQQVLVGIARYVGLAKRPDAAEAAIAVIDRYHGRGLGTLMFDALVLEALGVGIRTFEGHVLVDNRPMLRLLHRMGAGVCPGDEGTVRFELDLAKAGEKLKSSRFYAALQFITRAHADQGGAEADRAEADRPMA